MIYQADIQEFRSNFWFSPWFSKLVRRFSYFHVIEIRHDKPLILRCRTVGRYENLGEQVLIQSYLKFEDISSIPAKNWGEPKEDALAPPGLPVPTALTSIKIQVL